MTKDGKWHCNQKCLHCYAAGQSEADTAELTTEEWVKVIQKLKDIGIPQITFTGGEPTMRPDLVELIDQAQWFVTRLNTNGIKLSKELCNQLREASLDSVQITFYSNDEGVHNKLVGAPMYAKTVEGIKNALEAGLAVSINTPLCTENRDYVSTLKFLRDMGVTYVTCSGLIITGNARKEPSISTQLSGDELYQILQDAVHFCNENKMEISFTSPGWIEEEKLRELGLMVPSCGACLSNMAVAPNGDVVPCQSWLSDAPLGNMLTDDWEDIWNSSRCNSIRTFSGEMKGTCPLRKM
jgi:MoaA/NifB/PqqE/SkfB family radical SAM enzyme